MAIIINIDVMLAKRKMSVTELSERVGITMANISILKNGKAKAIRLSTLEAICKALECQPGDILEYRSDEEAMMTIKVEKRRYYECNSQKILEKLWRHNYESTKTTYSFRLAAGPIVFVSSRYFCLFGFDTTHTASLPAAV